MMDEGLIVDLLSNVLGEVRNHYNHKCQISFDCPVCSYDIKGLNKGDGKGNLEVNYCRGVFKCWSCSDTHDTHGSLNTLFWKWGKKKDRDTWFLIAPDEFKPNKKTYDKIQLPEDYISFEKGNPLTIPYKEAKNYLLKRGLTPEMIFKYSLGYTIKGPYRGRVIVPSFDSDGNVNYFVTRSYINHKNKYKNPEYPKEEIIFNESKIDWSKDIYLVEGVFDMFFIENSIPILGKTVSDKLWSVLYEKCQSNIIICLDGDAWEDGIELYRKLDGGKLNHRVRLIRLPIDKDVAELGGIENFDEIKLM
jgi:hypothetical protein